VVVEERDGQKVGGGEAAQRVADAAETAYMADAYGPDEFRKVARFLLAKGHSEREAEAILKSKHMRWADDSEGRGHGKRTGSAAFKRYYDGVRSLPSRGDWLEEGRVLAAETPSDLPPPRPVAAKPLVVRRDDGKLGYFARDQVEPAA
jgi:hypothetical protein